MSTNRAQQVPAKGRRIRGLDAEQRAEQRRDLLLDAALDSFARDGYAGTSIEALCQAAYVGNKAFYEHFSTKEACYLELLQRNTHNIVQQVTSVLEDAAGDEATATRQILTAFATALLDDPRIAAVTFGQSGGISPTIERQRRANRRQAAAIVLTAWQHFDSKPLDARADTMAVAVIGGLFDLVSDVLDRADYAPTAADIDTMATQMTDFVLTVRAGMRRT